MLIIYVIIQIDYLCHINLYSDDAIKHGQNNMYTNLVQEVVRDALNKLYYKYVLQFPRDEQGELNIDLYNMIDTQIVNEMST